MEMDNLLCEREYTSWQELEQEIEKIPITTEKGDTFERICYYYLLFHKDLYQISEIYTNKIPGREIPMDIINRLKMNPHIDDGVDGVYVQYDGRFTAYQAKFRSNRRQPTSNELNNFWSEAEYADQRLVMANCMSLPDDVQRRNNAIFILGYLFDQLQSDFFSFLYEHETNRNRNNNVEDERLKFTPRDYQQEILDACIVGFEKYDRGKVIAACATGKTLISLWLSEKLESKNVIFFAPNLALVRQTIASWAEQCNVPFVYLAVCSDMTVGIDNDEFTINADELDIAVTTDLNDIVRFITYDTEYKKVIFSTYQSVDCIIDAIHQIAGFSFDFGIYDEAHRTAGASTSGLFQKALIDSNIPIKKRLFMTATERLATPRIKKRFEEEHKILFSMDDEEKYGPIFYRLPFGKAISEGIIANYKIIVAAMTNAELLDMIQGNEYLTVSQDEEKIVTDMAAQSFFKGAMFTRAMSSTGASKAVSFHSSIASARRFADLIERFPDLPEDKFITHVNGTFSAAERSAIFKKFESSSFGLITNVRCLIEGVDIPYIDAIMFADPRNSLIDIVQAVGRALRKPYGTHEKTSYIIVPILLDENNSEIDYDDAFSTLYSIIQALRDQDEMLADWIDKINLNVVKGHNLPSSDSTEDPVAVILSKDIDYDKFCQNLALRISIANGKPTGATGLGGKLGRNERGSSIVRVFKTIADYNYEALKESLIDPTLAKFNDDEEEKSRQDIIINNNNVSHTERLGLIVQNNSGLFKISPLGAEYKNREISFKDLFINQMLHYEIKKDGNTLYPYLATLKVLFSVETLNYLEFLYGLYSMDISLPEKDTIEETIARIEILREEYPNVMATIPGNQEYVRMTLNDLVGIDYSEPNVWTDRTTIGNQYRFLLNHLSLLTDCFSINFRTKTIDASNKNAIRNKIEETENILNSPGFDFTGRI